MLFIVLWQYDMTKIYTNIITEPGALSESSVNKLCKKAMLIIRTNVLIEIAW